VRRKIYDANRWLTESGSEGPFFLFLQTSVATLPFRPEYPHDSAFDTDYTRFSDREVTREHLDAIRQGERELDPTELRHIVAQYDAEIATVDTILGDWLYRLFANSGFLDDTIFVLLSTHGTELFEHGVIGTDVPVLADTSLRVPLLLWIPGRERGAVVDRQVRLVDVVPTLCEVLEIPPFGPIQGSSLLPVIGGAREAHRPAWSEYATATYSVRSVRLPPYRLLDDPKLGGPVLFDVERDPLERINLAGQRPEAVDRMLGRLEEQAAEVRKIRDRLP
jgi:arylsulfatase A-like enzyme